ncbi:hypothetical protein NP233_g12030 [Leucocoprinus birnbaumii]|uniref:Uncharacterized protein n=1 Tax=Leucocoprinus birnbaumii TaxID=56174 RepID=A0AAD5VL37_9AGAR|nr:hypothetical protein NP233_g12030 [Leucocoprinus birnbaumii]
MKSPLRPVNGDTVPPVPPLPSALVSTQNENEAPGEGKDGKEKKTPAWVVPKSGLPSGSDVSVRRLSIERKVFSPGRGWEDSAPGLGSGERGEGGGEEIQARRLRRASAPLPSVITATATVEPEVAASTKVKCTCGARDRTRIGGASNKGSSSTNTNARRGGGSSTEWTGDRIDIWIGRGKARVLYDDESVDTFLPLVVGAGVDSGPDTSGRKLTKGDNKGKGKKKWWKFGRGG